MPDSSRVLRAGPAHLARIGAADVPRRDRPLPTARMSNRVAVGRSVVSSGGTAARAARMASTNARVDCALSSTATRAKGPGGVRVELGGRDLGRDGTQRRTGRVYRRGPRRLSVDP